MLSVHKAIYIHTYIQKYMQNHIYLQSSRTRAKTNPHKNMYTTFYCPIEGFAAPHCTSLIILVQLS